MPIPVLANFDPQGMKPNVVGGQRVNLTSVGFYDDTRTSAVAPGSEGVVPARFVAFDATGDFDTSNVTREPRLGVKAADGTFAATDFAGMALNRQAAPVRGVIASAQTVNDTLETYYTERETLSRAVQGEWWVEFDSATAPAYGAAVFVDNVTAGSEGRASASVGVALPTTVIIFTGRVETGWDGKNYASFNIPTKLR